MIYTDSIEILLHPPQSTMEPLYQSRLPVISWEAPILTILRENIWWRTCLSIKMEEIWMNHSFYAISIHSDRHIAFKEYTL